MEAVEGNFVAVLELTEVVSVLLHCVIRKVNVTVMEVDQTEWHRGRPNIPLLEPIALVKPINLRQQHKTPEINLPLLI